MFIPHRIRLEFRRLGSMADPLENLRSLEMLGDWVRNTKLFLTEQAQEQGRTLEEIGEVQERPRQAVHRSLKASRSQTAGLTGSEFDGVSAATLRYWFDWWSDPARDKDGEEERGRDPRTEAAKILRELEARFDAGVLRKPAGGLKAAGRG